LHIADVTSAQVVSTFGFDPSRPLANGILDGAAQNKVEVACPQTTDEGYRVFNPEFQEKLN
jgi:hypothetical protein